MTFNSRLFQIPGYLGMFAAALMLQACAGLGNGYEKPTVTISSFRALPSTGALPNFEIGLHVINPNRDALEIFGVSYTVSLDGHEIIKGVGNDLPSIGPYDEGTLTLTAGVNLLSGIRLISDLMNKPGDTFAYSLDAKLDVGRFSRAIRVRDTGEISLGGKNGR